MADDRVVIGKVGAPSGLRGEVRITLRANDSSNLKEGKVLLLKHAGKDRSEGRGPAGSGDRSAECSGSRGELALRIERVRYQNERPVVKLEGIDDRTAAESLRGMQAALEASALDELPAGEHYVRNIIGCRVVDIAGDADEGTEIGILRDVIQNTAQSILEVETAGGRTVLIPAVDAFMRGIDEEAGLIKVELIPGFLD